MSWVCGVGLIVLAALWGTREYYFREYRNRHNRDKKVVL